MYKIADAPTFTSISSERYQDAKVPERTFVASSSVILANSEYNLVELAK